MAALHGDIKTPSPDVAPPTLEELEVTLKTKLITELWTRVSDHKLHGTELSDGKPDYSKLGLSGMRTNIKHTLIAQRLFPKLSLVAQAERADGVTKDNVTNTHFNIEQLREYSISDHHSADLNITSVGNVAYLMLYGHETYADKWCLIYQFIMRRHLKTILSNKSLPPVTPKIKTVSVKSSREYKARR